MKDMFSDVPRGLANIQVEGQHESVGGSLKDYTNLDYNRERWLMGAVRMYEPIFLKAGMKLPEKIRVGVGFTSAGKRRKPDADELAVKAEAWASERSADGTAEIIVAVTEADPITVLGALAPQLVRVALFQEHGDVKSGPLFKASCQALGLDATKAKDIRFADGGLEVARQIAEELGAYPHAALSLPERTKVSARKKQTTRNVKLACGNPLDATQRERMTKAGLLKKDAPETAGCPYTLRMSRGAVEAVGLPHCPIHGAMHVEEKELAKAGGSKAAAKAKAKAERQKALDRQKAEREKVAHNKAVAAIVEKTGATKKDAGAAFDQHKKVAAAIAALKAAGKAVKLVKKKAPPKKTAPKQPAAKPAKAKQPAKKPAAKKPAKKAHPAINSVSSTDHATPEVKRVSRGVTIRDDERIDNSGLTDL